MSEGKKRWQQRFFQFEKALENLQLVINNPDFSEPDYKDLMRAFEDTHELSWKTLQELLIDRGYADTNGARIIIDQSFELGYIEDAKAWMHMILNRNLGQKAILQSVVEEVVEEILETYLDLFLQLHLKLKTYISEENNI